MHTRIVSTFIVLELHRISHRHEVTFNLSITQITVFATQHNTAIKFRVLTAEWLEIKVT